MFFPLKLIFSTYVPGCTKTVSPSVAIFIPSWIVVQKPGTFIHERLAKI